MAKRTRKQEPEQPVSASTMTDEHKAALSLGREQSRAVRAYLDALETYRPKRGRQRTPASIRRRLEVIDEALDSSDSLTRLHLLQERMDLERALEHMTNDGFDMMELEEAFVNVAAEYGDRKGVTYDAWRAVGVPPAVLKRAGIGRSA